MKPIMAKVNDRTEALAAKIKDVLCNEKRAEVFAMGPAGINQAIKALVAVNLKFQEEGSGIAFIPEIESKESVKKDDLIFCAIHRDRFNF